METIAYLSNWTGWLAVIITAGATTSSLYFSLMMVLNPEESEQASYKKKILYAVYAAVIALTIGGTIETIKRFY